MGVLKVNVGSVGVPDWRKIGCGGSGASANLLTANQAGFELGAATGWAPSSGSDTALAVFSSSPTAHTGTYCLGAEHTTSPGGIPFRTPAGTAGFAVTPGRQYTVSTWATAVSGAGLSFSMYWYDSSGTLLSSQTASDTIYAAGGINQTGWSQYTAGVTTGGTPFTAPTGAAFGAVELTITHLDVGGYRVFFDDIFVGSIASSAPGRLKLWDGTRWMRETCTDDDPYAERHPLNIWDGTTSAWLTVACMTPEPAPGGTFADTFDRTDSTATINPASDGGTWLVEAGTWGISSNKGYTAAATPNHATVPAIRTLANNQLLIRRNRGTVACDLTVNNVRTNTSNSSALWVSYRPADQSGYMLLFDSSNSFGALYRIPAGGALPGSPLISVTFTAWTGAGGTNLRLVHNGSGGLSVYQGATLKASTTDGTPLTGTWAGVSVNVGLSSGERWNDLTAT